MQPTAITTPEPWRYTVHIVIEVDAPHLRDASFPRVSKGHRVTWTVRGSRRECVDLYTAAVAGLYDYLSEFIAAVGVTASRGGKGRCVRVRVNRATPEMRSRRSHERLDHAERMAIKRLLSHASPAPVAGEIAC
jgi:hypothetical protein